MLIEIENIYHTQIKNMNLSIIEIMYRIPHLHPEIELLLVLEGNPIFIINGEYFSFKKDDIILVNSNQLHEIISKNNVSKFLSLHILPQYFEGYYPELSHIRFLKNNIFSENKKLFKYTFFKLLKIYFKKELYYQIQCASLINIMFYDILKNCNYTKLSQQDNKKLDKKSERLSKIVEYIEKYYYEKITLKSLASYLNLSTSFLSHFIKENLNYSFRDFLTYIRYINARALIIKDKLNLMDICYYCGFSDYKYMKNAFIKYSNCSPSDFKKKTKKIYIKASSNNMCKIYSNSEVEQFINNLDII